MRDEYNFDLSQATKNPYIDKLLPISWHGFIKKEKQKEYFIKLQIKIEEEYNSKIVYPPKENIFAAFKNTPLESVKVVILGQDPYHEEGQANGLAFSVSDGVKIPPSLMNIYKEIIAEDIGMNAIPKNGDLTKWAEQGVLLLNAVLTVRAHEANSHRGMGWETFTDNCLKLLNQQNQPIVFMLWGNDARKKKAVLDNLTHLVLEAAHPSPLSAYRGFFGCDHFKKCNEFLRAHGRAGIDWTLDDF